MNSGLTNGESIKSICFSTDGDLFTGLLTGVYRSDDDGISWTRTPLRDENTLALHSIRSNGFLFAGTEYGITRSTDGGESWSEKSGFYYVYKVIFGNDASGNLYTGYGRQGWWSNYGTVLVSTDFGENWNPTALDGPPITAMYVKPSGVIIAAIADSGIYLSTNQGEEWEAKGLNVYNINSVLLTNAGCMFAGTEDGILYRSCDNGATWLDISSSSFRSINSMLLNSSGNIFLADSNGVFLSTNNGDTWSAINSGLVDTIICTLKIDYDGYLYAGSANGVIYKSTQIISELSEFVNEIPGTYWLYQNYPNPFNPSTSIRFTIPQRSHVQLTVFDVLGCEVASLIDEEMEAGAHNITFQSGSLSSGVYIYRLKVGVYQNSKKMLLVH